MTAVRHSAALGVALLLAAGLLSGCGKKSGVKPPPGAAANYTYPRDYPAPLPGTQPRGRPVPQEEDELFDLSPMPDSDTTTTRTY